MKSLSRVRLFEIPWTAAHQAPPSMGFSRQEYWSGVPLPSPLSVLETNNSKFFSVQGRFLFSLSGVFFLPSLCMIHSLPLGEIFAQCHLLRDSILYQFIKLPFCILLFCAFFFGFYYICIGLGFCLCHPPECMLCERATLSYLFSYP